MSTPYFLEFELSGLPKNPNGAHGHWTVASAERKRWRRLTFERCRFFAPSKPLFKCSIECVRYSTRASDFDNLVASFKPIIDGLKDAKIIFDDNEKCVVGRVYSNGKAKKNEGKVKIIVREL